VIRFSRAQSRIPTPDGFLGENPDGFFSHPVGLGTPECHKDAVLHLTVEEWELILAAVEYVDLRVSAFIEGDPLPEEADIAVAIEATRYVFDGFTARARTTGRADGLFIPEGWDE
jgi:hypothetical protein